MISLQNVKEKLFSEISHECTLGQEILHIFLLHLFWEGLCWNHLLQLLQITIYQGVHKINALCAPHWSSNIESVLYDRAPHHISHPLSITSAHGLHCWWCSFRYQFLVVRRQNTFRIPYEIKWAFWLTFNGRRERRTLANMSSSLLITAPWFTALSLCSYSFAACKPYQWRLIHSKNCFMWH